MLLLVVLQVKFQIIVFETSKRVVDEIVKLYVLSEEPAKLAAINERSLANEITVLNVT